MAQQYKLPFELDNPDLLHFDSYVGNAWVTAKSGKRFEVVDPGTDTPWASCPANSAEDVDSAVQAAHESFEQFKKVNPRQRAQWLLKWDTLIREAKADLAKILTHETGKPIAESNGEIDYATGFTWWFAGEAERIHGSIAVPAAPNRRVFTVKQPIGVAAALVPWNFPIAMVLRKAGAALAAGCTMIVKPSPETPLTALVLAHLAQKAGFPAGVFNVLTTDLENTPPLSESLCKHPLVKKVTFTGSTRIGKLIASHCAHGLKKVTLELGGNCPFIVFDDANLEQALDQLMALKWRHAGQACITANRVYVQAGVYDKFAQLLKEKTSKLVIGHGASDGTTMGPLTTPRSIDKAISQVEDARQRGAEVILGGNRVQGTKGYFFEPTILKNMTKEMLVSREETFAPVAALYRFETEEEGVKLANDTSMGLASYAFTKNIDRMWRLLENLEAGMIGMNTGNSSAAESPFGGIKESGYGKESGKEVAVNEYLVTKTGTLTIEGQHSLFPFCLKPAPSTPSRIVLAFIHCSNGVAPLSLLAYHHASRPSLHQVIQTHPLIDNHAHNLLYKSAACNYAKYPLEQIISEAQGIALTNAPSTLSFHRAAAQLATLYQCPSTDWEQLKAARDQLVQSDYDGLIRKCLEGTHTLLLDDLLTDQDIEPYDSHDRFTASPTKRIVRIEAVAAQALSKIVSGGSIPPESSDPASFQTLWESFSREFNLRISDAIRDPAVVGFKSVICYRTGLNVQPTEDRDTKPLLQSFARTVSQATVSTPRVEDKLMNDWLVRQTLNLLKAAKAIQPNKPLQLHTGLGDNDIDLILSNPAHLQSVIAQYPEVDFVLLHSSYPYTREAGYLACVYPNVYLDLGEVFPMVSRDAQESIVRESLELVPTTRLLWSTDGHFFPETFWLANKQFRDILEKVFMDYVQNGDYTNEQAIQAAVDILFYNSNRLYCLNEQPRFSTTPVSVGSLSRTLRTDSLEAFIRSHPDVKYVWMQFIDYTSTIRQRMFPILEFAKIARKQRRIGICLAVFWMLQDDGIAGGSTTGQFYMEPDLSTLSPNSGLDSKSATVMTWWKTNEGEPIEGCPRTTLLNISSKLKDEFDIQATCGFEIEVVFLKSITDPSTGEEDFVPSVTNHSWSQMTRETRRLLPVLEDVTETLASIGIYLEQFHSESAPGQFEFILPPGSPVAAVDTLIKARQVITYVAEKHGLRATLHPRPYPSAAGTASHAHVSISPPTKEASFLAGILHHYPAVVALTLSGDASYDRVKAGLWAGSEWVTWGTQNREAPIRKISPGHWEVKSLDGLANMYLAMSAFLAAGYAGVKEDKPLTVKDCAYDAATLCETERKDLGITTKLPNTLVKSLEALESNKTLQTLLGPNLVNNYIMVKRAESKKLNAMDEKARRKWLVERY